MFKAKSTKWIQIKVFGMITHNLSHIQWFPRNALSFSRRNARLSWAAYAFPAAAVAAFGWQLKFPRSRVGRLREAEL